MGDAAGSGSGILIAVCAGIAVLSAAVGYVAERVVPVDKVPAVELKPDPPTIEKRVDTLETVVYNRNPQGAVAVPLPPPSEPPSEPPPSEPQGAVAVPLTPDMLSLPPPAPPAPPSAPPPQLGGGGSRVRIRISG